ncbi:hypothetical protein AVEN_203113-1 [Araneus ventricosus]|uniref:Mos1 transposase HTH domain-containing protein n=1 Tax=Araneus ventricosus TaxID=182803 RepID=A0A4Y2DSM4_ARAVE|nr:hypothetical protein AVEN_203113-1 [Araneus ventricosus]
MSEGMARKWAIAFKDGRASLHDEERSWRPSVFTENRNRGMGRRSVIIEDSVQKVDGNVQENRRVMISSLYNQFPQVSRSVLYGIVTEHFNYRKLCSLWAGGRFL